MSSRHNNRLLCELSIQPELLRHSGTSLRRQACALQHLRPCVRQTTLNCTLPARCLAPSYGKQRKRGRYKVGCESQVDSKHEKGGCVQSMMEVALLLHMCDNCDRPVLRYFCLRFTTQQHLVNKKNSIEQRAANGVWKVAVGCARIASHNVAEVTAAPMEGPLAATIRGFGKSRKVSKSFWLATSKCAAKARGGFTGKLETKSTPLQ